MVSCRVWEWAALYTRNPVLFNRGFLEMIVYGMLSSTVFGLPSGSGNGVLRGDAQRNEFYLANYKLGAGIAKELKPLRLAVAEEARACAAAGDLLIGPEVTRWFPAGRIILPRAIRLAHLAAGRQDSTPPANLEPIYLRATTFVKSPPARIV